MEFRDRVVRSEATFAKVINRAESHGEGKGFPILDYSPDQAVRILKDAF